jgi:hypothetical protein
VMMVYRVGAMIVMVRVPLVAGLSGGRAVGHGGSPLMPLWKREV